MNKPIDRLSFLGGASSAFVEQLYAQFLSDPASVDESWQGFFATLGDDVATMVAGQRGASWSPLGGPFLGPLGDEDRPAKAKKGNGAAGLDQASVRAATLDSLRALMLIRSYRVRGHLAATLDPLGLEKREPHPELDPASYGFTDQDLDRPIFIDHVLGLETATMRQIHELLQTTYSGNIGYEFMHIQYPDHKAWMQEHIEGVDFRAGLDPEACRSILDQLTRAEGFERFLQLRYTGTKRFGVEGGESLIPLLESVIRRAAQVGVKEIVIGMPHRGRLNVLANVMAKPYAAIFAEFQGTSARPDDVQGSGDVKYHLGTSADRTLEGQEVHLSLSANPSHLEAVNPVVMGRARAKAMQLGDQERNVVLPILMHGDAAFAGQGIVAECLGLSDLKGYRTGGTIHVIVNNQIGFTTTPVYSRSSPYPSDIAKGVQAPVFHVNGDDPEAVAHVARLALDFRQRFHRDVVIDMFCYRRHGHNEADEPSFTQPIMYKAIASHPTTRQIYAGSLARRGVMSAEQSEAINKDFHAHLEREFAAATAFKPNRADWLEGVWKGLTTATADDRRGKTAVKLDVLRKVGKALTHVPEGFQAHRTIQRQLAAKKAAIDAGDGIDWATAEALAFGSLLLEGHGVRLSGQDSQRGTFSQRHAVLIDQRDEAKYVPLEHVAPGQAPFEVFDSMLSEFAVLGFEYGYSLAAPNMLVLWEAQFGDFANGAQIMIDQFIASGESKWLRMSGLVMLLPHGFEGQGPEHSSARLERFLQLCAEDNIQVAYCSTPANYFHILRRQLRREFRKPLVLMTPKSLLRHKRVVSTLADLGDDSSFHRVLWDKHRTVADAKIKRVVLCTGKVYYDLLEEREKHNIDDVYALRVEQLYPYPETAMRAELSRFPNAEVVWCQEEPRNQGAWTFVAPLIEETLTAIGRKNDRPRYVGRVASASPATGSLKNHLKEQAKLVSEAVTL
ncbi:MAG: 2-oxoglutarate dehydrogenase E1 component [Alphaproteobacteria bacterium]|nr:2-oxoglutarate dehydrogenase E1 component [Alphaproteobacteria bacterium]